MQWQLALMDLVGQLPVDLKRVDGGEEALFWDSILAGALRDRTNLAQIHGLFVHHPGEHLPPTAVPLCRAEGRRVLSWRNHELAVVCRLILGTRRPLSEAVPSGESLAIGLYRLIQAWPEDGRYIKAAAHNDGVEILLDPAALPGVAVETAEQARAIVWTAAARTAWGESPWRAIRRALEHPHRFDDGEPARVNISTMCWLRLGVADIPEAYSWVVRSSLEDAWREERLIDGFCVRLTRRARKTGRKLRKFRPIDLVGPDGTAESWLWVANLHLFEDTLAARAQLPEGIWRNNPAFVHRALAAWPPGEKALFAWHPSLLLVPPLVANPKLGIAVRLPGVPPEGVQGAFEAALREAEKGTPMDALQRWLERLTAEEATGLAVLQGLGR